MSLPLNYLATPCVLLCEDGSTVTIPPSGVVSMVIEPAMGTLQASWSLDDTGLSHSSYIRVFSPRGEPELTDLPKEPGEYIISAHVATAWKYSGLSVPSGVVLYTPCPLVFPGQDRHPGGDVKTPVAPGLIMRYTGVTGRWR